MGIRTCWIEISSEVVLKKFWSLIFGNQKSGCLNTHNDQNAHREFVSDRTGSTCMRSLC